uniref:Uncharacterized protein n=1 Tax=Tanacetum cinerariifolium TaxID=118510 RepID=A0A699HMW0_TANCI|nr:hypothetical protein [Tanacetum cinerariifolium]
MGAVSLLLPKLGINGAVIGTGGGAVVLLRNHHNNVYVTHHQTHHYTHRLKLHIPTRLPLQKENEAKKENPDQRNRHHTYPVDTRNRPTYEGYDYKKVENSTRDCNEFTGIVEEHVHMGCVEKSLRRGVKAIVPERRARTAKDIEEPNELFQGDTIPRPLGKPRPTKSQKSDSSQSARSSSTGGEAFKEMLQEDLRIERQKNLYS